MKIALNRYSKLVILTTLVLLKHNKKEGEKALIITDSYTCLKYENRSFEYFGGVIGKASTASNNKTFLQIKDILGVKAAGSTFVEMWISLSKDIHHTRLWDTVLGVVCIITLLLLRVCNKQTSNI